MSGFLSDQELAALHGHYAFLSDVESHWICLLLRDLAALRADRDTWKERRDEAVADYLSLYNRSVPAEELRIEIKARERAEADRDALIEALEDAMSFVDEEEARDYYVWYTVLERAKA